MTGLISAATSTYSTHVGFSFFDLLNFATSTVIHTDVGFVFAVLDKFTAPVIASLVIAGVIFFGLGLLKFVRR